MPDGITGSHYVCRACAGTGRCPYCDGSGAITTSSATRACTSCAGSARCGRCAGTGYTAPHAWLGPRAAQCRRSSKPQP
jgi:DnaJ-class molecular chaperone